MANWTNLLGGTSANIVQTTTATPYGGMQQWGQQAQFAPSPSPPVSDYVPVIDEAYSLPLHFRLADGTVHSFKMEEILLKLGLKW